MIKEITEEKITELEKKSLRSWDKALGIRQDYLGKDHLIAKNFKFLNKEKNHPDFSVANNNNQKSYL